MKLTPAQVRQVQRGEKTQHRVPIIDLHTVRRPPIQGRTGRVKRTGQSATYETETRKPGVGDSIVIAPRVEPDPERNRPEILEVRVQVTRDPVTQTLSEMTSEQARTEGYRGQHPLTDFAHDWMTRHDPRYPPLAEKLCPNCQGEKVYTDSEGQQVECDYQGCDEVGTILAPTRPDTERIIEWFTRRHGHHLVYIIEFAHQADISLWLHRRPGLPPTTSIGEALDPSAPLLGEPSREWRDKAERRRIAAARDTDGTKLAGLDQLAAEYQAEAIKLAVEAGVDVTNLVREIDQKTLKVRAKVTRSTEDRRAA